jgi:outer membrane protein assembly factor BamB
VQCDVQKNSFLAAFDLKEGREVWRTKRKDVPTWSTPTLYIDDNGAQIIVNGWKHIGGYDAQTGKELWKLTGGGDIPVPTPIVAHNLIFITNAHGRMSPIYAIKPSASGDISLKGETATNDHIAWSYRRDGAYMQTPLVYGDYLFVCRDWGLLGCYEAKTGKRLFNERFAKSGGIGSTGYTASGVAANGKLYYTSEDGDVYVVQAGPEFKVLATNLMGEVCMATPAISEGALFFRTQGHVVAIAERAKR